MSTHASPPPSFPSTPPKTLEGIKKLAKKIKKAREITHTAALHEAAKVSGYDNYQHALNVLGKAVRA
ncbi:hypothetical protein [Pseudoxanthomonas sp. SE1]|uniref:hypothetical protein n=1 Tax=Pseudoxanthomonas sp. SE1 TaxID=1664560 RepID=UPI00240DAE5D|nr:hypothetical protein [Pseudoxanthomonas sp. SE1]WFC43204.1 hypothetical protein OY559_06755 [Pseudoxanthomonas sp. SE1]